MPHVVAALRSVELVHGVRDAGSHLIKRARLPCAENPFEFGEDLLDGIEIRAIRWQESKSGACRFDGGGDRRLFVNNQIVEHHDITRAQRRHQDLLDIGQEGLAINGPVEDRGGGEGRLQVQRLLRLIQDAWHS